MIAEVLCRTARTFFAAVAITLTTVGIAGAQESGFPPEQWELGGARTMEYLGRPALMGAALLKDVSFDDGIIEFDVAVTGARSYPGVLFRIQDPANYERVYIRPHRSGRVPPSLYSDVLQYAPAFNGIDSWQLYNGPGLTAPAVIPSGEWFHVRLEIKGTQARIFVGDTQSPALVIDELKRGKTRGGLGLMGPMDGSAYFSNFTFRADTTLHFDPPPPREVSPGIIRDWQISKSFRALAVELDKTPEQQGLADLAWKNVTADESGMVDVSLHYPRGTEPDIIFARTVLRAEKDRAFRLDLGYSDVVSVFLNGNVLFTGTSAYQSRDPSFLGIIGFFDTVDLPLKKGDNELQLAVAESFGGWGFMARDGEAVFQADGVKKLWETPRELRIPESAAYDPASGAIYVSNYDGYNRSTAEGRQFISKLTIDGRVDAPEWVGGLKNPTGLVVSQGRLFVVERTAVVEIDIPGAKIIRRIDVPGSAMLGDIAVDAEGVLYVSDFFKGNILRFAQDKFEEWLAGPEVVRPNGVWIEQGKLFWANNGDASLKSANLATKEIRTVAKLTPGILDGVVGDGKGNILVSHNEGRLYRVTPAGEVTKLLDTSVPGSQVADFTVIPEKHLLIIPGFRKGTVAAWQY